MRFDHSESGVWVAHPGRCLCVSCVSLASCVAVCGHGSADAGRSVSASGSVAVRP